MRILYLTDPHGMERHYRSAFTAALDEGADLLLLGGDLCPDLDPPSAQADWVTRVLGPWFSEFRSAGGCPAVGIAGNHETETAAAALALIPGLQLLDRQAISVSGIDLAGFPLCPPAPFPVKDYERLDLRSSPFPPFSPEAYYTEGGVTWKVLKREAFFSGRPTLEEELERFSLPRPAQTVLIAHAPPAGGVLDRLYNAIECGSAAIRKYILQWQPMLSLHGHAHESPFLSGHCSQRLGTTLSINPGQDQERPVWAAFDPADVAGTWKHSHGLAL